MATESTEAALELVRRDARVERRMLEIDGEHDLRSFIQFASPDLQDPVHMAPLCEALDRSMVEPVFIVLEAPPRHWKTVTVLHHIARRLKCRPTEQVAYASYSNTMAFRKSRTTREIAARSGLWAGKARMQGESKFDPAAAVSHWQTRQGGGLIAGGRGGGFMGEGFGLMVLDDLYKNREEAESTLIQDKVWEDLWQGTLSTRAEPGCSVLSMHQPWNEYDINARLMQWAHDEGIDIIVIQLPAVANPVYDGDTLVGGEALCPQRYDIDALALICSTVGSYNWESQYQLNRVRKGKTIFPEFRRYAEPKLDAVTPFISCDPGIDGKEQAEARKSMPDPAGIVVGNCWLEPHEEADERGRPIVVMKLCVQIVWACEVWLEGPDLMDYLEDLQGKHYGGALVILEEVSAFRILGQVGRRMNKDLEFVAWTPQGSKALRAQPTAKATGQGRVTVPQNGDWLMGKDGLLAEARKFNGKPGGKDNRIDALVQLFDFAERRLGANSLLSQSGSPSALAGQGGAWGASITGDNGPRTFFADLVNRSR